MFIRHLAFTSLTVLALAATGCAGASASDDSSAPGESSALTVDARANGRFEVYTGNDDQTYFRLVAANGENLLRSEGYVRGASTNAAMESMVDSAKRGRASRFEILAASSGGFYINVTNYAAVPEVIGTSQVYASRSGAVEARGAIMGYLKGIAQVDGIPATTGSRFHLYETERADQPFMFQLHASNGEVVLQSEAYSSRAKARQGIAAIIRVGARESAYSFYETESGRAGFHLKAENGEAVGHSELYSSRSNAERGMRAVINLVGEDVSVSE